MRLDGPVGRLRYTDALRVDIYLHVAVAVWLRCPQLTVTMKITGGSGDSGGDERDAEAFRIDAHRGSKALVEQRLKGPRHR